MKNIKNYKEFNEKSKFVDQDDVNEILDKISELGIDSLSDIEMNKLNLFSEGDEKIVDIIDKMGDITLKFKELNNKMNKISSEGGNAKYLMDDWMKLNDELRPLESKFRNWGIELGDIKLNKLMSEIRPDAYPRYDIE